MPSLIETERRGRVEIVRMRRPDHGNRVTQQMAEEMIAALGRTSDIDAKGCRRYAEENYSAARMADHYQAMYRRLAANNAND